MLDMDQERENFHLVVDDYDVMYMTKLVKGHEEIHMYVEHPIDDLILVDEGEDVSEVFMIVMTYMLMIKLLTIRMSQLRWMPMTKLLMLMVPIKVTAFQVGLRRIGKELIIEHPPQVFIISDDSDSGGGGSGLDDEVELNHVVRDFVEDNSDSWDCKEDDVVVKQGQMGAFAMNSDYHNEELYSLVESSSDELGYDSDDDDRSTYVGNGKE
nr:hypothetical protein CFP56_57395 [Quercus suber]